VTETAREWLPVSEVAARLGVSNKTVLRRVRAGRLTARKVAGARGGFAWEVAPESTGQPAGQEDKTEGTPGQGQGDKIDINVNFERETNGTNEGTSGQGQEDSDGTRGQSGDLTARYLARLESENDFLRRALETAQQSEAQTKAALREALRAMPKQLEAGDSSQTARMPENGPQKPSTGKEAQSIPNPGEMAQDGEESGEMSAEELRALCFRVARGP